MPIERHFSKRLIETAIVEIERACSVADVRAPRGWTGARVEAWLDWGLTLPTDLPLDANAEPFGLDETLLGGGPALYARRQAPLGPGPWPARQRERGKALRRGTLRPPYTRPVRARRGAGGRVPAASSHRRPIDRAAASPGGRTRRAERIDAVPARTPAAGRRRRDPVRRRQGELRRSGDQPGPRPRGAGRPGAPAWPTPPSRTPSPLGRSGLAVDKAGTNPGYVLAEAGDGPTTGGWLGQAPTVVFDRSDARALLLAEASAAGTLSVWGLTDLADLRAATRVATLTLDIELSAGFTTESAPRLLAAGFPADPDRRRRCRRAPDRGRPAL